MLLERGSIDEAEQLIADTSLDDVLDAHRIHFVYRGSTPTRIRRRGGALADFSEVRRWPKSVHSNLQPSFCVAGPRRCAAAARANGRGASASARSSNSREIGARRTWWASRCARSAWSRADKPMSCCCARRRRLGVAGPARTGAGACRPGALLGAPTAALRRGSSCVGSRARPSVRRHRSGRTRNDELAATGAPRTILLSGLDADGERAAGCSDGGRRDEQQGDRPGAVCHREDGRAASRPRLPQARHRLRRSSAARRPVDVRD